MSVWLFPTFNFSDSISVWFYFCINFLDCLKPNGAQQATQTCSLHDKLILHFDSITSHNYQFFLRFRIVAGDLFMILVGLDFLKWVLPVDLWEQFSVFCTVYEANRCGTFETDNNEVSNSGFILIFIIGLI